MENDDDYLESQGSVDYIGAMLKANDEDLATYKKDYLTYKKISDYVEETADLYDENGNIIKPAVKQQTSKMNLIVKTTLSLILATTILFSTYLAIFKRDNVKQFFNNLPYKLSDKLVGADNFVNASKSGKLQYEYEQTKDLSSLTSDEIASLYTQYGKSQKDIARDFALLGGVSKYISENDYETLKHNFGEPIYCYVADDMPDYVKRAITKSVEQLNQDMQMVSDYYNFVITNDKALYDSEKQAGKTTILYTIGELETANGTAFSSNKVSSNGVNFATDIVITLDINKLTTEEKLYKTAVHENAHAAFRLPDCYADRSYLLSYGVSVNNTMMNVNVGDRVLTANDMRFIYALYTDFENTNGDVDMAKINEVKAKIDAYEYEYLEQYVADKDMSSNEELSVQNQMVDGSIMLEFEITHEKRMVVQINQDGTYLANIVVQTSTGFEVIESVEKGKALFDNNYVVLKDFDCTERELTDSIGKYYGDVYIKYIKNLYSKGWYCVWGNRTDEQKSAGNVSAGFDLEEKPVGLSLLDN